MITRNEPGYKKNIQSGGSKRQTAIVAGELVVCFLLIYVSVLLDWPKHDYLRFTVILPLYQIGTMFGYSGGLIGGIVVSLLFVPLFPLDPYTTKDPYGYISSAAMLLFINFIGVFIGGTIGMGRRTQQRLKTLSDTALNIAGEADEVSAVRRMMREVLRMTDSRAALALVQGDRGPDPEQWSMIAISAVDGAETRVVEFDADHPLVRAARDRSVFATNSTAADPRFTVSTNVSAKSLLAAPLISEDTVCGAVMLADKARDLYTRQDLAMTVLLADTAAETIHNIRQERARQEEQFHARRMQNLLSRFVSESVAEYVLEHPGILAGEWREITLLVADIREFTQLAERTPPRELVSLLNEYFTVMVDVIIEHKGTIDKYIGDCIIAYWGAPMPDADHAPRAAAAAAGMVRALDGLNAKCAAEGVAGLRCGIALHTGRAVLCNVGDDRKRSFTLLGPEVRRAVELESLTKIHDAKIIVSGPAALALGARAKLERIDTRGEGGEDLFRLVSD